MAPQCHRITSKYSSLAFVVLRDLVAGLSQAHCFLQPYSHLLLQPDQATDSHPLGTQPHSIFGETLPRECTGALCPLQEALACLHCALGPWAVQLQEDSYE